MKANERPIRLLLVDDEEEFRRATTPTLTRRGFEVSEAASALEALEAVRRDPPDVVLLDLKMPGLSGIEALRRLREISPTLPVIILTGHGRFVDAVEGIRLEVVDFLQKPVDLDELGKKIRALLEGQQPAPLRETTIAELMLPVERYPKLHTHQTVVDAMKVFRRWLKPSDPQPAEGTDIRSALLYDGKERFVGIIRLRHLLKLVLPGFLLDSPYSSYFTGMFLAQCKLLGNRTLEDLAEESVAVNVGAPLTEAIALMVQHKWDNLPVTDRGAVVGVIRAKDIAMEISRNTAS